MLERCVLPDYGIETIVSCWKVQQPNRTDGTAGVQKLLLRHRSPVIRVHGVYDMPKRRVLPNYGIKTIMS